jgi:GGDEF domain-containing protein
LARLISAAFESIKDATSHRFNRRGFDDAVGRIDAEGSRSASMIVCDIDHFKAVNDEYRRALKTR